MEKLYLNNDADASPSDMKEAKSEEERKLSIQRSIEALVCANQCRDDNCKLPHCQKMKLVITHTKICKRKRTGGCSICKQMIAMCCYHVKHCQDTKCSVPTCFSIKQKLKRPEVQQRLLQVKLRRSMAAMNTCAAVPASSLPPVLPSSSKSKHYVEKAKQINKTTPDAAIPFSVTNRSHTVYQVVKAIFPTLNPTAILGKRMKNIVTYAREIEFEMYERAESVSEYYLLIAEKIYKIEKELEERWQKRKKQQLLQTRLQA